MPKPFSVVNSIPYWAASALELRPGDEAQLDDRLAEALPCHLLLRERLLELVACEQALLDEESSEGPPGDVGRFHQVSIGRGGRWGKYVARNAPKGVVRGDVMR